MRRHLGVVLVAGMWMASTAVAGYAQSKPSDNPAPCSVTPQPDPCGTTPATGNKPNAAEKFPFPGEAGAASAPGAPAPSLGGVPPAPDAPDTPDPNAAAGAKKEFPFPGDAAKPDAGSSSSSSSSSGDTPAVDPGADSSGSTPGLADKGSEGSVTPGRHILHRVNPPGEKLQSADEREAEDLSVAHFYIDSGDLKGAYLRSQDAVKTAPDDPEAHFTLAEIALKLNKKNEAIAEYNACLKLDPIEKEAKDARKALAHLKP